MDTAVHDAVHQFANREAVAEAIQFEQTVPADEVISKSPEEEVAASVEEVAPDVEFAIQKDKLKIGRKLERNKVL